MGYLYILGAALFGTLGIVAVSASSGNSQYAGILSWASWLLFWPAFMLLFFAYDIFWVLGGYALWALGMGILSVIVGRLYWNDKANWQHTVALLIVFSGLLLIGLGGSV